MASVEDMPPLAEIEEYATMAWDQDMPPLDEDDGAVQDRGLDFGGISYANTHPDTGRESFAAAYLHDALCRYPFRRDPLGYCSAHRPFRSMY